MKNSPSETDALQSDPASTKSPEERPPLDTGEMTLGMERVAFEDFARAWTRNAKNPAATQPGLGFIRQKPASDNWALIIRRRM